MIKITKTKSNKNFLSIDANGIELTQLTRNRIAFKSGDIEFSITGQNFNANLLEVMNLISSGSSFEHLIDAIDGRVTSIKLRILQQVVPAIQVLGFQ